MDRQYCIEVKVKGKAEVEGSWVKRHDETLHKTYAATREECVEKALAADDYDFFPSKEVARRSLMEDGWAPVECDNGTRILLFVDP